MKRLLLIAAIACLVTALAQPHFRKKEMLVERTGLDVMIAIDVSNSMLAKDIAPNRLEKAKLELAGLIDKLKGDKIGVVAFAGDAIIQCPLTFDKNAVKLFLGTANPNLISFQGTSVYKAIGASLQAFGEKDKEKGHKAIVLLTDGENHEPAAEDAARRAKSEGVRIFTIGIGTPDGSVLPDEAGGVKRDRQGQPVISRLNESLLKKVAQETDGVYYRSSRGEVEVDNLVREIRRMAKKGQGSELSVEYEESFQLFLLAAILILLAETMLSEARKEAA